MHPRGAGPSGAPRGASMIMRGGGGGDMKTA